MPQAVSTQQTATAATPSPQKYGPPVVTAFDYSAPSVVAVAETLPTSANASEHTDMNTVDNVINVEGTVAIHAEAVAVVDAEIADSRIETSHTSERHSTFYWLIIATVVVAVSAGVEVEIGRAHV